MEVVKPKIRNLIRNICDLIGINASKRRMIREILRPPVKVLYDVNHQYHFKRCLLIYIVHPFLTSKMPLFHQNVWQARELVRIIGELDYTVDVADYQCDDIELRYDYDLVIGLIPRGIDIYSKHMRSGCKVVAYLTSSNGVYTDAQGEKRAIELKQRRGVYVQPRRGGLVIEKKIEQFDAALFIGNEYNLKSYSCFEMPPVFFIKNTGHIFANSKIFFNEKSSKKYVYFGSSGSVHKGLDLLLEVFSELGYPYELYVCGNYIEEEDFCKEYEKELYFTPNIHPVGRIEIGSEKFWEIMNQCSYSLLPSCAEGQAGSVLTTMSAGVINICSVNCGFSEEDVILFPNCSKETITEYVVKYGNKDEEWVNANCREAIDIVKERYSEECFTESVRNALEGVLKI